MIDLDAEKARLSKGAEAAEKERDCLAAAPRQPHFTERAKPEAVEKARADHDAKVARLRPRRLRAALGAARLRKLANGGRGARARRPHPGPIARTLLAFALPTLASSILQSLNGTVNAIWVGRFLGEGALAATSNANIVMFLLFAFVFGFGMASTILIGQAFGRKDVDGARRVFGTAIGLVPADHDR